MVDKQKVEQAIRLLLEGIGEDTEREGLKDTPDRIARMCMEIYGGLDEEADHHLAKQFEVENNEMVLEKDISNCDRTYVEKRIPTQYEITSYIVATGADPIP